MLLQQFQIKTRASHYERNIRKEIKRYGKREKRFIVQEFINEKIKQGHFKYQNV